MTPAEVLARLRAHTALELPAGKSRRAAVLVPLRTSSPQGDFEVILTRRTDTLQHHRGQVAFPGGVIESQDASPEAAALREAHEELSLPPDRVEIVSRLDDMVTGTGFHIVPVVGVVHPEAALVASPDEVARCFAVPLEQLMAPTGWTQELHERGGNRYLLWHYPYDGEDIWGVTGAILHGMMRLLRR